MRDNLPSVLMTFRDTCAVNQKCNIKNIFIHDHS